MGMSSAITFCFWNFKCAWVYVYTLHDTSWINRIEGIPFPETEVIGSCKPPYRSWELDSGPLQKQPLLLTPESSLWQSPAPFSYQVSSLYCSVSRFQDREMKIIFQSRFLPNGIGCSREVLWILGQKVQHTSDIDRVFSWWILVTACDSWWISRMSAIAPMS